MAGHNAQAIDELISRMDARVDARTFVFVSSGTPLDDVVPDAMLVEPEGTTYVVELAYAARLGLSCEFPCRRIDLGVETPLDAVGFLARILAELAVLGIAVNPMAGFHRDTLFVPQERADDAVEALHRVAQSARLVVARGPGQARTRELVPLARDIWFADGPTVRFYTMPYGTRTTIVRLSNGELFVHSPIALSEDLAREVVALGPVRHLVAPNRLHHLFLADWRARFPQASIYGAKGVAAKEPGFPIEELTDAAPAAWAADLDQLIFRGSRLMEEAVFHHCASGTLILADLIENFDPHELGTKDRWLARLGGVLAPRGGMPRDWQLSFFGSGRVAARMSLARMLSWNPARVVLAHGNIVPANGRVFVERALAGFA